MATKWELRRGRISISAGAYWTEGTEHALMMDFLVRSSLWRNRQWVTDNSSISGEEFETLFLGLNEEEFVEWVFMINWRFECSRGMAYGHRQEDHILPFEHGNHVTRIERTLSLA